MGSLISPTIGQKGFPNERPRDPTEAARYAKLDAERHQKDQNERPTGVKRSKKLGQRVNGRPRGSKGAARGAKRGPGELKRRACGRPEWARVGQDSPPGSLGHHFGCQGEAK